MGLGRAHPSRGEHLCQAGSAVPTRSWKCLHSSSPEEGPSLEEPGAKQAASWPTGETGDPAVRRAGLAPEDGGVAGAVKVTGRSP